MSSKQRNPNVKDFLFDLGKIVEGALAPDPEKVRAYTELLRDRLEKMGEAAAAKRLDKVLGKRSASPMSLARTNRGTPPVDSESRLPLADMELVGPSDVVPVLDEHTQQSLEKFVSYVQAANELIRRGVPISASLLLYGPPGCGKTMLAREAAHRLGLPLITARTDSLISSYLGSTAKNLRSLFDYAMARPCVLFLDEFDALGKMRDDARELGELKRVVISLLQNIDAMGPDHVLIAATNHEHLLDRAIWRRFARKIRLDLPGTTDRHRMLSQFLRKFSSDEDAGLLAHLTHGLSGAELHELCNEAIREAVLSEREAVDLSAFLNSIGTYRIKGTHWHDMSQVLQVETLAADYQDKITQAEIGRLTNVTQSYVSKVLSKEKRDGN